jgi:4'-phosphopantetheinyl transferase
MLKIFYTENNTNTYGFLKYVLENFFDKIINQNDIKKGKFGKPYLKDQNIFFNFSNTSNISILAVSDTEIGIDAEKSDRKISAKLAEKYFFEEDDNIPAIKLWTIKESFIKYLGKSLLNELKFIKIENNSIFYKDKKEAIGFLSFEFEGYIITAVTTQTEYEFMKV